MDKTYHFALCRAARECSRPPTYLTWSITPLDGILRGMRPRRLQRETWPCVTAITPDVWQLGQSTEFPSDAPENRQAGHEGSNMWTTMTCRNPGILSLLRRA